MSIALPPMPIQSKLHPVLRTSLRKASGMPPQGQPERLTPWNESFLGIEKTQPWREASPALRTELLHGCNQNILEEAVYIEDAGMSYTARMTLLARSEQEKILYSLFSADEATHYSWFKEALGPVFEKTRPNEFHHLLMDSITTHPAESLVFLIQVFLEGWGIQRYTDLMRNCRNPRLREQLGLILQDEARHHGSGVVLNREGKLLEGLPPGARIDLLDTLQKFLGMVRAGPMATLQTIESCSGGMTRAQKIRTLEELGSIEHSQARLDILKNLMIHEKAFDLIEKLESWGSFTPLRPEESV